MPGVLIACLSAQFELHYSAAAPDQVSSLVTIVIEKVRRLQRGRAVSGVLDMTRLCGLVLENRFGVPSCLCGRKRTAHKQVRSRDRNYTRV